jgi:hypothetical protein
MRKSFFTGIFLAVTLYLGAVCKSYASDVVKFISNVNGLTNNSVNCIFEDSEHILWVGTWDGLNAYDGRDIRTYRYSRSDTCSISNNIIRQITECGGNLWISTDDGINELDRKSGRFRRFYPRTGNMKPNSEKSFIIRRTPDRRIICFVKNSGFFIYDSDSGRFVKISVGFAEKVKDFCVDAGGRIVFLFRNGSAKYEDYSDINDGGYEYGKLCALNIKGEVKRITVSGDKCILITAERIYLYEAGMASERHFEITCGKTVSDVSVNGNDLYAGFIDGGCMHYYMENGRSDCMD